MAPRPFWKGYLKLSLVTCPVQMEPARSAQDTLSFHTINRKTGNRVESRYVDAESGKPVPDTDQVKGYPLDDRYSSTTCGNRSANLRPHAHMLSALTREENCDAHAVKKPRR